LIQYALLGIVVIGFVIIGVRTWRRNHGAVLLRRETGAQEVTFQLRLDHAKAMGSGWTDLKGEMALIVRTDTFEVSATVPLFRAIFPMDYYFRARDTTIEVGELPAFIQKMNWIVVRGQQGGMKVEVAFASRNHLYDAWVALVRAGAVPIGPPPPITP
jgi:hypothetical protein